jgi:hypothetical protein
MDIKFVAITLVRGERECNFGLDASGTIWQYCNAHLQKISTFNVQRLPGQAEVP